MATALSSETIELPDADTLRISDENVTAPVLPQQVWDKITRLIFVGTWEVRDALLEVKRLSLTCKSLQIACQCFPMQLDATHSFDAHIDALSKSHIQVLTLDMGDFTNRESLLRNPNFIKNSGPTLERLTASVHCTDTLQHYPRLQYLKLYGQEFFRTLYPAVLQGLRNLKELELEEYHHKQILSALIPSDILSRLDTLRIRHLPHLGDAWQLNNLAKPAFPAKLKKLVVDGSFNQIQAANFSPMPSLILGPILDAAEDIRIEGYGIMMAIGVEDRPDTAQWMAEVLTAPARWNR